ncbi:unnamed protein product [Blepharisma stoltei]|uniref:Uncharacterized protein n=1 Tax=Blepharisma stoltei TaxID=1481888 RepID=A0AAU9IEN2_9CILI|nr:unnamed protein product [Blepharisma stoltei]
MTENIEQVLNWILKPQYKDKAISWAQACTSDEMKGLKLIGAIFKHKGKKKFRKNSHDPNTSARSVKAFESELRKRQLMSTYESEFSYRANPNTNILQYRKLGDIQCSEILTPLAVMFIEEWIDLKDDPKYQSLVLQCLRSLNAIIKSSSASVSETHKSFLWNDPTKNFKPHRLDQVSSALGNRSQSASKPWVRPNSAQQVDTKINPVMFTKDDLNKRKQALISGSGIIGKWVVAPTNPHISHYQETYVTHFHKYMRADPGDKYTSISVGRMLPTPDISNL